MADLRHVQTRRLRLDAYEPGDVDGYFALMADPAVWEHLPSGVHTSREQTEASVRAAIGHWDADGLGYWIARLRDDLDDDELPPGLAGGALVGSGGVARRAGTGWWNLYYRLARPAWGRGLAAEIVAAGLDAARAVDPDRPVVASLLEHNTGSRRLAERSGLALLWRGPDAGNPDPAAVRLVYADRPLDGAVLAHVTALA